jgi:hypothetical protein
MQQGGPFDRFLRQFGPPDGMPNNMQPRSSRPVNAEGSGFFISADGYAVTNTHVVDHAKTVQVVTDDGKILTAKVIGTDPKTDLALIKVDGNDFPFVKFAPSCRTMVRCYSLVCAFWAPLQNSATARNGAPDARDASASSNDDGLDRCRYKGSVGMNRWVGLGVIADNVVNIGHAIQKQATS